MRSEILVKPKTKTETFKVSNFITYSDFSKNCFIQKEQVGASPNRLEKLASTPNTTQSAYFVGNRMFLYTSDKYLYEYINYSFKRIIACPKKPVLMIALIEGKEEVLVLCGQDSFILDNPQTKVTVPEGDYWANYKNRLFIAKAKTLYYGGEFDYNNLTMNISNFGTINIGYDDGNIVALIPFENNLLVFCTYAIYTLNISDNNDFVFTKCNTCSVNIITKSPAKVGDEIIFVSNRKICSFKNGKVEVVDTIFENYLPNSTARATGHNGHYAIFFRDSYSQNCAYIFNTITRKANVVSVPNGEFIGGKYFFTSSEKAIYQINEVGRVVGTWTSLPMDFGTHHNKILKEISVYSATSEMLSIYSDSVGYRFIPLNKGNNYKKINLLGKNFWIEVYAGNLDMRIKDLQFKYTIIGD